MNDTNVLELILFVAVGLGVGSLHFATLWWAVKAHARASASRFAWALHGARVLITAAVFVWVASSGALPLLGALAGFLLARPLITRLVVRPA